MEAAAARGGGGGNTSSRYQNIQQNNKPHHHVYRPSPPLTAIDRFLWGQSNFSQQQQQRTQNIAINNKEKVMSLCAFSSTSGASTAAAYGGHREALWPSTTTTILEPTSFVDGFFSDGTTTDQSLVNWSYDRIYEEGSKSACNNNKGMIGHKRSNKKGASVALIKGQWTDEEDR